MNRSDSASPSRRERCRRSFTSLPLAVLLTCVVLCMAQQAQAALQFVPRVTYPVGHDAFQVLNWDLDGDGAQDLVVTNSGSSSVSVFMNTGDGTFTPRVDYPVGIIPIGIAAEDLDQNGSWDLVIANQGSNSVSLLFGNGDGTFGPRVDYETGLWPWAVAIEYFDSDAYPDIVAANYGSHDVSVLINQGDGTFAPRVDYALASDAMNVAVGELNGDEFIDLAVPCAAGTLAILPGLGDGTFGPRVDLQAGSYPRDVAIFDLNEDGLADIVTANRQVSTVSVFLALGGGDFTLHEQYATGVNPGSVCIADVDNDYKPDIVTSNETSGTVSLLRGNGLGGFLPRVDVPASPRPFCVAAVDVNGDGIADLITADSNAQTMSVLMAIPPAPPTVAFHVQPVGAVAGVPMATAVEVIVRNDLGEPVPGDHVRLELVGSPESRSWDWAATDERGIATFSGLQLFRSGTMLLRASNVDGAQAESDVFTVSAAAPAVLAFRVQPSGVVLDEPVSPPVEVVVSDEFTNPVPAAAVELALSGTGVLSGGASRPTNALGLAIFAELRVSARGEKRLMASCGAVAPVASQLFSVSAPALAMFDPPIDVPAGRQPQFVAIGDLNGDQYPDLAVANSGSHTVTVHPGLGNGTFGTMRSFSVGSYPARVVIGDLNDDGKSDLVSCSPVDGTVTVMLGRGDGVFGESPNYHTCAAGAGAAGVALGDLNGDVRPDIAVANYNAGTVSVLFGNGDGSFAPKLDLPVGQAPRGIAIGDFDRDGFEDLVVAHNLDNNVWYLRGNGAGGFAAPQVFATAYGPYDLIAGDVDRDGVLDLVTANMGHNDGSVLLGNGDGTFGPQTEFDTPPGPRSVAMGDLDGDGSPELAVPTPSTHQVSTMLGRGDGTFDSAVGHEVPASPSGVAIGDLNRDGRMDMVSANSALNGVTAGLSVFLNISGIPTPTLIEVFRVVADGGDVRIEWRFGLSGVPRSIELQRGDSEAGEWVAVAAAPRLEGTLSVVVDEGVPAGHTAWYRLSGVARDGRPFTFGPLSIEAAGEVLALALAPPHPNPSAGRSTLTFDLPKREQVRMTLTDLQGRVVAQLADGMFEAGRHVALLEASDLRAGVYFVHLQAGGGHVVRRMAIVR